MTEQFYHNIAELKQTGTACLEYDAHSLDAWVLTQLAARRGESVLNLGGESCEQIAALARTVGEDGYVLTIDRSYRVLNALSQRSLEIGMEKRVRFLYLNLNNLSCHLRPDDFERVLGGRALYHVKQPEAVFQAIRQTLKPGGVYFFYGPARKDLAELRTFYMSLSHEPRDSQELFFIEQIGAPCARETFSHVEFMRFEYPRCFTSPDSLYAYWRESDLYEEALDRNFRYAAVQHFQRHTTFETAQRLIGVRAVNG